MLLALSEEKIIIIKTPLRCSLTTKTHHFCFFFSGISHNSTTFLIFGMFNGKACRALTISTYKKLFCIHLIDACFFLNLCILIQAKQNQISFFTELSGLVYVTHKPLIMPSNTNQSTAMSAQLYTAHTPKSVFSGGVAPWLIHTRSWHKRDHKID